MKKTLLTLAVAGMTLSASAQDKGRFEVYDLGNFKLHVYYTNDALGDASYIIEGRKALVTMEQPLFKDNVAEFDAYLSKLGKKVGKRITDYHVGGKVYFTHWAPSKAHASHLQISSPAAIDAEIAEARKSLESGAELFIGGHGGAAEADAVQFKIDYLMKMKEVLGNSRTVQDFVDGMKKAFPGLPGEAGLEDLGRILSDITR